MRNSFLSVPRGIQSSLRDRNIIRIIDIRNYSAIQMVTRFSSAVPNG